MSRIPKIGSGIPSAQKAVENRRATYASRKAYTNPPPAPGNLLDLENRRATIASKKVCEKPIPRPSLKRLNENQLPVIEKKRRTQISTEKDKFVPLNHNVASFEKVSGFSEAAKRAVFKHPSKLTSLTTVRESMPAISISNVKPNIAVKKAKRPAWDLKGRIQDMEEHFQMSLKQNTDLKQELELNNQRIVALESANEKLNANVEIKCVETQEASSEIKRLQKELKETRENLKAEKEENRKLNLNVQVLSSEKDALKEQYHHETTSLKNNISSLTGIKLGLQTQVESSELVIEQLRQEIKLMTDKNKCLESENFSLKENIDLLEAKQRKAETERRKLHNTIQELKGNIRVYCRMRPPLQEEIDSGLRVANIVPVTEKILEVYQQTDISMNDSGAKGQPKHEFAFDCIFSPTTSQNEVFHEISQLVQSSLDGYNVCIFAYGQTGSGKTYTMEGPESITDFVNMEHDEKLGMIPRAVQQIFEHASSLASKGWKYTTEVSFLEVYNERIHDLLNSSTNNCNNKCEIKKTGGKGVDNLVSNVTTTIVTSTQQVFSLLRKARVNRAVATTKCNERSSRSHYIFQMKMTGENSITSEKCEGTLNLVDLAGSERIKDSGSEGDRLQEAKYINKSLSNLGNVIMALSQKADHIPYRNSKLTHLLMNSLGGNSKTLMFVNISPDSENINETINSLRFATKVNQCNIGTAQKKIK